mgnify:CR=1 FL=1|jgi:hypothetical protein|tara:strand:+ start:2277 stop:2741 length:465 start_codon:yes stop_codon:yes gene_type:complete
MAYITGMDVTEVSDTATFALGQKGIDVSGNTFKYVQYDTGAGSVAAVSGQVAYYYAPSGASAGAVNVVTSDLSDSNEVGGGVLQSAPTDGQYCWVQIGGTATLSIALTAGADGDPLTPTGAGDGTLDVTAAATSPVCAFAIDASAKIIACQFAG